MVIEKQGLLIVEVERGVAVVVVVIVVVILLSDFIQLQITSNGNKTANIYVKNCSVYIQSKGDIMVIDIKQQKSQFNNSNITITQCQKNFADCVMVKFEFLNCNLCCFISTTTTSPLHCSLYKLNSFFLHKSQYVTSHPG